MKFSEQWLRQWANPELDTSALAEQLTMLGLEVDTVTPAAAEFTGVVVGEIIAAEQHPDADRLRCCTVDIGADEALSIVCGGVNAGAGIKVACAVVGAILPGDFKIKAAKLRGQPSAGMLCSHAELGLGEDAGVKGGIIELPEDAPVGQDLRQYLALDDNIIDIELTPNRGDCASILGITREVCLANQMAFSLPSLPKNEISSAKQIKVSVTNSQACPRYVSRVIENINANAVTPIWLQEQLRRSGHRCIHPVVDILNYVMLELGQPMHAFDLAKINGEIQVRSAAAGEKITLLDEQQATLDADTLVISDASNVIALAGVMGGADSAVSESTTAIVLESAFFAPLSIRRASSVYNIKSESSYRFERGVDWNLQTRAMERATELILQFCGGQAADIVTASSAADLPQTQSITLRAKQLKRILGVAIADEEVTRILTGLQLQPHFASNQWQIEVPSFRFDLQQEIDLVEEVVRVYGYQQVPTTLQNLTMPMVSQAETQIAVANIKESLVAQGYQEAITYSFISAELMQQFTPNIEALTLNNPISSDLSHMRASILPSLISALKYNLNRQCSRVRLFEVGRVYLPSDNGDLDQPMRIAMLANGTVLPEQWSSESRVVDYFDMKADVEALLQKTYQAGDYQWNLATHSAMHPGKTAELTVLGQHVGFLGELHPTLVAEYSMATAPVLFEGNWALMSKARVPAYAPISRFPVMRRDLALVLEQSYCADEILAEVRSAGGSLLSKVEIFDIYQGKGIAAGKKSVALGLIFQDASRTLVEEEVETVLRDIVMHLQNRMDATMRA